MTVPTSTGAAAATSAELASTWDRVFQPSYGTPPLALVSGHGAHVRDADGIDYIDLYAGIAVSALGHAHPAVVEAVRHQIGRLAHASNYFLTEPTVRLGERLCALVGGVDPLVFLCNSGAEANEAAIKLARRARPGRAGLVAVDGGFHGRTLGALSITGQPGKRAPFEPLLPGVTFVPHNDPDAMIAAVTADTAAVFVEPVLGEAGVVPSSVGFLMAARDAATTTGAVLVFDEVQGGIGRAGAWFSHRVLAPGVAPDVITLAKGLGGGLPIGACVSLGSAGTTFRPGDHGTTFGGNPVAAAAALAVLDTIDRDGLLAAATAAGDRLRRALRHDGIDRVRGVGLWLGVELREPVGPRVEAAARSHGVLVNAVNPRTIRLAPALPIPAADIDEGAARLLAALDEVTS